MKSGQSDRGNEVSGDALGAFRLVADRAQVSEELFRGLEHLHDDPKRFAWDEICTLYKRLGELTKGRITLREAGHMMFEAPKIGETVGVVSAVASPKLLYTLGNKFGLSRTFNHLQVIQRSNGDGTIEVEITIPETHQDSPGFFELTQGVLEAFPILLGLPHARVELAHSERRGLYKVRPPESRTIVARMVRAWRAFFSGRRVLEQLDIQQTELNEQFHQLQAAYQDVQQALEVKRQFLNVMSHELRTPLNGILGASTALEDDCTPEERREMHHALNESAQSMTRLVEGVLEFVRSDDQLPAVQITESVDLVELVNEVVASHRVSAEHKGLIFRTQWSECTPKRISVDETRLRHVLDRVLDNGVKFTHRGGVTLELDFADNHLVIRVTDTGVGVAEADRSSIFELFSQVDGGATRRFGGAGLGLAVVKRQVDVMGGRLELESELDAGSTFTVTLPVTVVEAASPAYEAAQSRDVILVVDDNRVNRMVVGRMLKKLGWEVIEAEDGQQAVELAAKHDFAMVFMDCEMPVMNGWDATETIVSRRTDIPIVALTAYVSDEDRARCRAAGMVDFLPKPITSDLIERTVNRWTDTPAPAPVTSAATAMSDHVHGC